MTSASPSTYLDPRLPVPEVLAAALRYAERGWRVIPLPVRHDGHDADGKAPVLKKWVENASNDPEVIAAWWAKTPTANVGIVCDDSFGFVLDIDDPRIIDFLPKLPITLTSCTPSGGSHMVFRHPAGAPMTNKVTGLRALAKSCGWEPAPDPVTGKERGVDIRGRGGQIVAAPSVSPKNDKPWSWIDPDAPIAAAPDWLLDVLRPRPLVTIPPPRIVTPHTGHDPYIDRAVEGQARELAATVEGSRGKQLFAAAARLGELGVTLADTEAALLPACDGNGLTGKDGDARVRRELRRGWDQGASNPVDRPDRPSRDWGPRSPDRSESMNQMPDWHAPHPAEVEDEINEPARDAPARDEKKKQGESPADDGPEADGIDRAVIEKVVTQAIKKGLREVKAKRDQERDRKPKDYLRIDRAQVQTSDPPLYTLTIGGATFTVTSTQLIGRHLLQRRVMEVCGFVPSLPPIKADEYRAWVNEVLGRAEKIETPPESSPKLAERAVIAAIIRGMPESGNDESTEDGEGVVDPDALERGCVLPAPGGLHILSLVALQQRCRSELPGLESHDLTDHLRKLGWLPHKQRLNGRQVRTWRGSRRQGDDE
jgi:hypothetical protein